MPPETKSEARRRGARALVGAGIETASLDARLLLQAATGLSHAQLIDTDDEILPTAEAACFDAYLARRLAREPISRILGKREFQGLAFMLSPETLDPRPDTETLVDMALKLAAGLAAPRLLDLGTGTGAIIISLLHALPGATAIATDISASALVTAGRNAEANGVANRLRLVQADWFGGIGDSFDIIVSNPPYIPQADIAELAPEVRLHDPHLALAGGEDGLDCYRQIIAAAPRFLAPGGHLLLEIGQGQSAAVRALLDVAGFAKPAGIPPEQADLGGVVRVLAARFLP